MEKKIGQRWLKRAFGKKVVEITNAKYLTYKVIKAFEDNNKEGEIVKYGGTDFVRELNGEDKTITKDNCFWLYFPNQDKV
jgi:hypothetical protein